MKQTQFQGFKPLPSPRESKPSKVSLNVVVDAAGMLAKEMDRTTIRPSRLAAFWRQAEEGDPRAQALFFAAMIREFGHLISVFNTRILAPSTCEWTVTPHPVLEKKDKKLAMEQAEVINDYYSRTNIQIRLPFMMQVLGFGYAFEIKTFEDRGGLFIPRTIDHLAEDRVKFDEETNAPLIDVDGTGNFEQVKPEYLIYGQNYAMSGNPQTNGLFRPTARYWMMQSFAWKDWAVMMERYATPILYTQVNANLLKKSGPEILSAMRDLGSDGVAVLQDTFDLKTLELKNQSADHFDLFVDRSNKEVSKIWLGQTATSEGTPGMLGNEAERSQVRQDLKESDGGYLERTITEQDIVPILGINWDWGPKFIDYPPVFKLKTKRPVDQESRSKVFAAARNEIGVDLDEKQVREELGLRDVEGVEKVLKGQQKAAPQPLQVVEDKKLTMSASSTVVQKAKDEFETMVGGFTELLIPKNADFRASILSAVRGGRSFDEVRQSLVGLAKNANGNREVSGAIFKALGLWAAFGRYDAESHEDFARVKRSIQ